METKSEQGGVSTPKRTRPLIDDIMKRYDDILKQIYRECEEGTIRNEDAIMYIHMLIDTVADGNQMIVKLLYEKLPPIKFRKVKEIKK